MVLKSTNSNFGKSDGRNRRNSGTWGGPRRSLGPETPAPPRGEAGMASCLASTCGWGPPARRRRAEIPGLMEINSRGQLPESGATDVPGNIPGNRTPKPTAREIPREIPHPGKFPGNLELGRLVRLHGEPRWGFPGEFPAKLADAPDFHRVILREFGRRILISLFPPFCNYVSEFPC